MDLSFFYVSPLNPNWQLASLPGGSCDSAYSYKVRPCNPWQGWLVLALFLAAILGVAVLMQETIEDSTRGALMYIGFVVVALAIAFKKGPSPKWRWGSKPTDNLEEDF